MTEATVEATDNLLPEAQADAPVADQTSDLPTDDKPLDDATPEGEAKVEDKPEPSEVEKVKHGMQKRIDKQTAILAERERQLEEAQKELRKYITAPKQDAPKEEDFATYEEFLKAQGRWEVVQEQKAEQTKQAQADRDAAYQKTIAERKSIFEAKEAELKKVTPDYDEKVKEVESSISLLTDSQKASTEFQVFRDMLFSSDDMPALTYELGKNPDLLDKLLTMNPLQIARQIARLELQIENAPKQQHKPVTAPPTPISSASKANKSVHEMSYKEMKKAWKL